MRNYTSMLAVLALLPLMISMLALVALVPLGSSVSRALLYWPSVSRVVLYCLYSTVSGVVLKCL